VVVTIAVVVGAVLVEGVGVFFGGFVWEHWGALRDSLSGFR
jgi:hypothetical protein